MSLRIKQEATYTGSNRWDWSVWLEGPDEEMDQVDFVVYTLHPTFPSPVRRVTDRKSNFRLKSAGWGEFRIYLDIVFKNGQTRRRKHWLQLRYPEPKGEAVKRGTPSPKASPRIPKIYLSYGVADVQIARSVRAALTRNGFEILATEDMASSDIPFGRQVDDTIRRTDAAVFIISGRPSLWVMKEIDTAFDRKDAHVVPVVVGEAGPLPPRLQELKVFHIQDPEEAESVGESIARQALADLKEG